MKITDIDQAIMQALKADKKEINIHDMVMLNIEKYEQKRMRRSYITGILFSSFIISLSLASIVMIQQYFQKYESLLKVFYLDAVFIKGLFTGMFIIFIIITLIIAAKAMSTFRGDRKLFMF